MSEVTANPATKPNLRDYLFRPFERIAGWPSLILGIAILLLAGALAYYGNVRFNGVLDMHMLTSNDTRLGLLIWEQLINWLSLALILIIIAFILRKDFRIIDLLGTQAMARYPTILIGFLALFTPTKSVNDFIKYQFLGLGEPVTISSSQIIAFSLFSLASLLLMFYMYYLMYRSFSLSCNASGGKGITIFILGLLVAEVISKFTLGCLVG